MVLVRTAIHKQMVTISKENFLHTQSQASRVSLMKEEAEKGTTPRTSASNKETVVTTESLLENVDAVLQEMDAKGENPFAAVFERGNKK